ncbi:MAG: class I SAM-dependent methyltransferase [Bdellovibrionales bacterium]|nr:class I SAM-dependent methyltransferase [Bdellovibrionales bacterium]
MPESRQYNAEYYDAFEWPLDDVKLYSQFTSVDSDVLELGCGTGRVSLPLAKKSKHLTGVEISEPMHNRAQAKCQEKNISFLLEDITSMNLNKKFDLVIAPFRVLQCLEQQELIDGIFNVIHDHLKNTGTAILNVFNPLYSKDEMAEKWIKNEETFCGETILSNGDTLKVWDTRDHLDAKNQVLHPKMIYRRYRNNELVDFHTNPICMRYWYPDQFTQLIEAKGFTITNTWGGYNNEVYGEGPELTVAFEKK